MSEKIIESGDGYSAFLSAAREVEEILHAHPEISDADLADGYMYLAGMWEFHLERMFKGGDVDRPCFVRVMDSHRSWGLSTPDHHYYAAQIDGNGEYRITGKKGRTVDYCFEILSGLVGDDGVPGERIDALEVGGIQIEADGTFELFVGTAPRSRNWLKAGPTARTIFVRQTTSDWYTEQATAMLRERLELSDDAMLPRRLSVEAVEQKFRTAARNLVQQVRFLESFRQNWLAVLPLNELPSPVIAPADAGYFPGQFNTKCRFSFAPGEALLENGRTHV